MPMTQTRLANGRSRLSRYRPMPATMKVQMLAVEKKVPISTALKKSRDASKPGE